MIDNKHRILLNKRVDEIKIDSVFRKYSNVRKKIEIKVRDYLDKQDIKSNLIEEFLVKRSLVDYIIGDDFKWFLQWNYDAERIEPFHFAIWDFLHTGKLSQYYRRGAKFLNYNPKSNSTLIMITRGAAKTSFFASAWANWEVYRDRNKKLLLVSGTEKKAKGFVNQIQKDLCRPYLNILRPDFYRTDKQEYRDSLWSFNKEYIDVPPQKSLSKMSEEELMNLVIDNRKEYTYHAFSTNQEPVSMHFDKAFIDDLVTPETSRTLSDVEKTDIFQKNLRPLAHNPSTWAEHYTGTAWYEGTYERIRKNVTSIVIPCRWFDEKAKTTVYLSSFVKADTCDQIIKDQGMEFFKCNYLMESIKRNKSLKLIEKREDIAFRFSNEDNLKSLLNCGFDASNAYKFGCVVTSYDPSYSKENKSWYDKQSKLAILTGVIYNDILWLYSYRRELGGGTLENVYNILLNQVKTNNSDVVVVDSDGYQKQNSIEYQKKLTRDYPNLRHFLHHTKKSAVGGSKGKAERAKEILTQFFREGRIKVHHSMEPILQEITREIGTFDFLDTIIQIVTNINFEGANSIFEGRKVYNNFKKRTKYKPTNSIMGY